jgi:hypothetical protein
MAEINDTIFTLHTDDAKIPHAQKKSTGRSVNHKPVSGRNTNLKDSGVRARLKAET